MRKDLEALIAEMMDDGESGQIDETYLPASQHFEQVEVVDGDRATSDTQAQQEVAMEFNQSDDQERIEIVLPLASVESDRSEAEMPEFDEIEREPTASMDAVVNTDSPEFDVDSLPREAVEADSQEDLTGPVIFDQSNGDLEPPEFAAIDTPARVERDDTEGQEPIPFDDFIRDETSVQEVSGDDLLPNDISPEDSISAPAVGSLPLDAPAATPARKKLTIPEYDPGSDLIDAEAPDFVAGENLSSVRLPEVNGNQQQFDSYNNATVDDVADRLRGNIDDGLAQLYGSLTAMIDDRFSDELQKIDRRNRI